jgi:hypothetical protein
VIHITAIYVAVKATVQGQFLNDEPNNGKTVEVATARALLSRKARSYCFGVTSLGRLGFGLPPASSFRAAFS